MAADANIFAQYLRPVKSMQDYGNDMDAAEQNRLTLQSGRMKAQQDQRAVEDDNALRAAYQQSGGDPTKYRNALIGLGNAKAVQAFDAADLEAKGKRATIGKTDADTSASQVATTIKKLEYGASILSTAKDQQTYAIALQALESTFPGASKEMPPQFDPQVVAAKLATGQTIKEKLAAELAQSTLNQTVVRDTQTNDRGIASDATARAGQKNTADIAAAGRAQSAAQFGVTTGLQRERLEFDRSKPGAVEGKPMTAAQESKYRAQIAKDYQSANTNLANLDGVLASIGEVRSAPGLKGATGLQSYIPSMPNSNAAQAEVKLKNLEGKITQLGKAAAAQGGAVGPMAVQEWKIVRDMIAAIEPQKGDKALLEQMALVESATQGAAARIRDAYEKQYGADFERYPQFQNIAAPKGVPKPAGGQPAKVASDADYNALPSGATFVGPDGKTRRKP